MEHCTRDMAEKLMGGDVRRYAGGPEVLQTLLNRINSLSFDQNAVEFMPNDQRKESLMMLQHSSNRHSNKDCELFR